MNKIFASNYFVTDLDPVIVDWFLEFNISWVASVIAFFRKIVKLRGVSIILSSAHASFHENFNSSYLNFIYLNKPLKHTFV